MGKSRIENIFNECLDRVLTGTETVEQCLQRYPDEAKELELLLGTAVSVNKAVNVEPDPELKARIRYNLQLAMADTGKPRRLSWFSLQPRWAMAIMSVMLVFVLGGGMVLAADSSMPGSLLYPVKLLTENISLKLAGSDMKKAELSMTFADRRVAEMNYIMENAKYNSKNVEAIASRYINNLEQANSLSTGEQATLMSDATIMESDAQGESTAPRLTTLAPSDEQKEYEEEAAAPEEISHVPPAEVASPSPESLTTVSWNNLQQTIYYYGYYHVQQLEKWLNDPDIPEEYKPAIRRMIQDLKYLEQLQLSGQ